MNSENVDQVLTLIKLAERSLANAQQKLDELQIDSTTKQLDQIRLLIKRCHEVDKKIIVCKTSILFAIVEIGLCLPEGLRFDSLGKTELDYWINRNPRGVLGAHDEFINVTSPKGHTIGPRQISVEHFVNLSRPDRGDWRVDFYAFCKAVLDEGLKYLDEYSKSHSEETEELGKLIDALKTALQHTTAQVSLPTTSKQAELKNS